jgi:hypothetical protein
VAVSSYFVRRIENCSAKRRVLCFWILTRIELLGWISMRWNKIWEANCASHRYSVLGKEPGELSEEQEGSHSSAKVWAGRTPKKMKKWKEKIKINILHTYMRSTHACSRFFYLKADPISICQHVSTEVANS